MTERQIGIDDALARAAECELIGRLAADPDKRQAYRNLAEHFRTAAANLPKRHSQDDECRVQS
jgi:hypothetical protein